MLTGPGPRALPRQVRPRAGESVLSFIARLARANHLRPSHLHFYLCNQRKHGRLDLALLGAVTGRLAEDLKYILATEHQGRRQAPRRYPPFEHPGNYAKAHLHHSIRITRNKIGASQRELRLRYNASRRTVRKALRNGSSSHHTDSTRPTVTTQLEPVAEQIARMLRQDRDARQIWEILLDEHDIAISFSTLKVYLWLHRLLGRPPTSLNERPPDQIG